jgi:DNA-directed RNA polymerase specialized sigma24 family protein
MSKYTKIAEIARREALRRFEKAARTDEDFHALTRMYDKFDENRERRERYNEILCPTNEVLGSDNDYGTVIPPPLSDPYWRELMRGDFLSAIFDNADEIWQIIGDWCIGVHIKNLPPKQREVLFLKAVRLCTAEQIACYTDKTARGVRKLLAAALERIRSRLTADVWHKYNKNALKSDGDTDNSYELENLE